MVEDDNSTEEDDIFQFIGWLFHCGMAICFSRKRKWSYIDSAHCRVVLFFLDFYSFSFSSAFIFFPCPFVPCCCGVLQQSLACFHIIICCWVMPKKWGIPGISAPPIVELMGDYFWECPALRVLPDVKCCRRENKKKSFFFWGTKRAFQKMECPLCCAFHFPKCPVIFYDL